MMPEPLTLVCPSAGPRLRDVIETALCDLPVRNAQDDLRGARILFALDAGSAGMDEPTLRPVSYTHLTLPTICSV